jgi:predicted N-acetyltransferase YhbS
VAVTIRAAEAGDEAEVAALADAMGGHDGATANPAVGAVYREALEDARVRMLVAEDGGRVVGYAEVQARPYMLDGVRQGWLAALCVTPGRRGEGVGAALVEAVDAAAAAMGCDEVVVDSSSCRVDAHRFYRSAGFADHRPAHRFRRSIRSRT